MISWKQKDKIILEKLISKAYQLYDGKSLIGENIPKFEKYIYIISDLCSIRGYDNYSKEKRRFVRSIINPDYEVNNLSSFVKVGREILEKQVNPSTVAILFRFHVDEESIESIKNDTTFGKHMESVRLSRAFEILTNSYNVLTQNRYDNDFWSYSTQGNWLKYRKKDKNFLSASSKALYEIELLRALLNFIIGFHRITFQSRPMQLTEVSPSRFFFELQQDDNIVWWKYTLGDHKDKDHVIQPDVRRNAIRFINRVFELRNNNLKEEILSSIMIFNEALDNVQRDYTFLLLWTIIDKLIPDIDRNHELIKNIYPNISDDSSRLIDILHAKRNVFVHQGRFDLFNLQDVNLLKSVIEDLILFAIRLCEKIHKTEDLLFILKKSRGQKALKHELKLLRIASKIIVK